LWSLLAIVSDETVLSIDSDLSRKLHLGRIVDSVE
jgi:hypothetical protein